MANTKISDFTSGAPAQSTDEFVIARTGANFKLAASDIKTLVVGAGSVSVASGKTLTANNTLTLAGTDSTTMTFPSTSATLARTDAGNTFTGNQTVNGGTITADAPVLNMSQTWNASGVTFTGLRFNAATGSSAGSAAASLLMDLQLEGTSQFSVRKNGDQFFSTNRISFVGTTSSQEFQFAYNNSSGNAHFSFRASSAPNLRAVAQAELTWVASTTTVTAQSPDTILTRRAAANLRLGAADAAAPVAQTLSVQSVVAGTSNTAGQNFTITGSQGTGTGAGGSIIFQVAPAGSSGTAQNALVNALTINADRSTTVQKLIFGSSGFYKFDTSGNYLRAVNLSDTPIAGFDVTNLRFVLETGTPLGWGTVSGTNSPDLTLFRDAADTLALRNGTNAQTFNIYNTFTSSTNFERFRIVAQSANTVLIGTQKGSGGGTARALELQTDATSRLTLDTVGSARIVTALTVATLPATPLTGMIARVTDALAPAVGATVAAGGAAQALCWYNGTNWTVIGV